LHFTHTCAANTGYIVDKDCDMRRFRADHVDAIVWEWVEEYLTNPVQLAKGLRKRQAEQHELAEPLRERVKVVEDLLVDHKAQLGRALDLYLSGGFPKEMLTERKTRLEKTIESLERERDNLLERLDRQTITEEQLQTIAEFALEMRKGLDIANADFELRRQLIDMLEMEVTLAIEDEQKIVYVHCLVGRCMFRSMPTIDSDGCRPLVPGHADHPFQRHVDHFSELIGIGGRHRLDSVDDMIRNPGSRN
jgi:hypothetical protein